jgi:DNA-binding XRE family transcriptional regulator
MWSQVSDLNDLDADVLDMLSALWIQQARDPNDFARISVKKLLEMRGLKAKTGAGGRASGFRPEQKQQLFAAIQHISNLYLLIYDLEVPRADNKGRDRREVHSRAFVVTDILGNRTPGSINLDIEEFLIRPGVLFGHFLFGPGRQLALLSSKAIQYDRIRQEWEKRLARYFSWIWRNDATNDRPVRSFLVKTLLEAAGKQVDEQHPKRTRDRLEKALSTLRSDKVIASWEWDRNRTLPFHEPRNWQDYWLDWSVRIEMPQFVQKYYQNISQPGTPGVLASPKTLDLNLGANTASPQPKDLTQKDNLASRLFTWRKEHRHSQAQMAALLGVTQSFYSHLERGSREPSPETRHRIENLLKRPL